MDHDELLAIFNSVLQEQDSSLNLVLMINDLISNRVKLEK